MLGFLADDFSRHLARLALLPHSPHSSLSRARLNQPSFHCDRCAESRRIDFGASLGRNKATFSFPWCFFYAAASLRASIQLSLFALLLVLGVPSVLFSFFGPLPPSLFPSPGFRLLQLRAFYTASPC